MNILWSESGNMSFCQSLSTHFYDIPLIDLWWLAFARFETIRLQLGRQKNVYQETSLHLVESVI